MARRSRVTVEDVLQHLDSDASFDYALEGGSDDDLGMDSDYDYESVFSRRYYSTVMILQINVIIINNNTTIYIQRSQC